MNRSDLAHVLRGSTQGSAEAKNESADHKDGKVWRLGLHNRGDDGKSITRKVYTSTTIDVGQDKEWCSANTSDEHWRLAMAQTALFPTHSTR